LVALVAIPATVALALAGVRVFGSVADVMTFQRAETFITLGESVDAAVDALEAERTQTVLVVADGSGSAKAKAALKAAQDKVDVATQRVKDVEVDLSGAPQLAAAMSTAMNRLTSVPALRSVAARLPATSVIIKYSEFTADLIAVDDLIIQGTGNAFLTGGARALAGLARAKDAAGQENDRITAALLEGRFESDSLSALTSARSQRDNQLTAFRAAADLAQLQDFDDTVAGSGLDKAEGTRQRVMTVAGESPTFDVKPLGRKDVPEWLTDSGARIKGIDDVEGRLINALSERSRDLQSDAMRSAILDGVFLMLVLIAVFLSTLVVANSLVRPLRRLRAGALEVAGQRLPELVLRLRDPEAAANRINVEPIDIDTTDEIGQVARAFDEVHREAVRLAANEAVLRGDISAMFVNLSRRSQTLIERQLRLIDDLEQGEQDEERLAALFRLDHLATRMRRNCENLLVLGGQDQARRWNRPVPLLNVVRASLSEVEQFDRVELRIQNEVSIGGPVVNDLVHLIAELIENAIVFSPEHTPITVAGSLIGGGLMVQITDQGVGMTDEELADANLRLKSMPATDVSAARRMGLFVVGRLAARHGIRVELRPTMAGGVTAFALLPSALVSLAGDPVLAGPPAVGQNVFERQAPALLAPQSQNGHHQIPDRQTGPQSLSRPTWRNPQAPAPAPSNGQAPWNSPPPQPPAPQENGGWRGAGEAGMQQPEQPQERHDLWRVTGENARWQPPPAQPPAAQQNDAWRMTGEHPQQQPEVPGDPWQAADPRRQPEAPGDLWRATGGHARRQPEQPQPQPQPPNDLWPAANENTGRQPAQPPNGGWPAANENIGRQPAQPQASNEGWPVANENTGRQPALPQAPNEGWHAPDENTGRQAALPQASSDSWQVADENTGGQLALPPASGESRRARGENAQRQEEQQQPRRPDSRRRPEASPIFEAMTSEWFVSRDTTGKANMPDPETWRSPADAGWQLAETTAASPQAAGRTAIGLPKRVPGQNRLPGAVPGSQQPRVPAEQAPPQPRSQPQPQQPQPQAAQPVLEQGRFSAEARRARFGGFQRGVQRGREETGPERTGSETGENT
jgi:anti-sigma regulatory factor (Ser/Thr protein kinase)